MKIQNNQEMNRNQIISKLKSAAPVLMSVSFSDDMGYEFSAIVPTGIIFAEPGMLLEYSGGCWPPDDWEGKTNRYKKKQLEEFLLDDEWSITAWENIELNDLQLFLDILKEES